ncbi:MAG: chemotaxis protein CheW [Rectinemataceae bacterium]
MAQTETATQSAEARKTSGDKIDFKMITFSLAGKEYGIDIMSVKEIAKAGRFTYVPNAAPFVRGVYNLRGDIISVIDLRTFFHLPAERKEEDALESLLILRIDEHVFGVIVDGIDKVVAISSAGIQPPHPIFGDINVKFIKGIVENSGKLYIILDAAMIFAPSKAAEEAAHPEKPKVVPPVLVEPAREERTAPLAQAGEDVSASFVRESLAALKGFHITGLNELWFQRRYSEWRVIRKNDVQIREPSDAETFLEDFWSPSSGMLLTPDFADSLERILPGNESKNLNVWNPGCGKGYETWSLAVILRRRYPDSRVKIWANDSDLLAISMAPNMVFPDKVPDYYAEYMTTGRNGQTFIQHIRDSIFFEFHDILNTNSLPPLDIVVCRDLLSLLSPVDQRRLLDDFSDKLKPAGILVLGSNEVPGSGWLSMGSGAVSAFRKE